MSAALPVPRASAKKTTAAEQQAAQPEPRLGGQALALAARRTPRRCRCGGVVSSGRSGTAAPGRGRC